MRLISWNVRSAGDDARIAKQVSWLAKRRPDIVALQEVTPSALPAYVEALTALGLKHVRDGFQCLGNRTVLRGSRRLGTLLASRWPLRRLQPCLIPWPERVLGATVTLPGRELELYNAYVPAGSSNGWTKIRTLEGIYARLARPARRPRVLCGDFNLPQAEHADGTVITWGQTPAGRVCRGWGRRWDAGERNVLLGLGEHDLLDVFRRLHGYERQAYSWYTHTGVGRRFDHVFASGSLSVTACRYEQQVRLDRLSDHAAVEVDFR